MLRRFARRLLAWPLTRLVGWLDGADPGQLAVRVCPCHGPQLRLCSGCGLGHEVWLSPADCRGLAKALYAAAYQFEESIPADERQDDATDLRW